MRTTKESAIVVRIVAALKKRGCFVIKLHGGPMQRSGLPDLLVLLDGRAVFLEVKRPGEQATPLQVHTLRLLRVVGAVAEVVTSVEEACRVVFRKD